MEKIFSQYFTGVDGRHFVYWSCHLVTLMIVNYFDILWAIISPNEAKPVLIIYSDAVLAFSISL